MASWSKLPPGVPEVECSNLAHVGSTNCLVGSIKFFFVSSLGSAGFFFFLYLFQYLTKLVKKKKKASLKEMLKMHLRSTLFGSLMSTGVIGISCIFRSIIGRYAYFTMILIPAFLGGFAIFLENRKSRELFANALSNCALEFAIHLLERENLLKWNANHKTVTFMIFSSVLSALLSMTNYNQSYFWCFIPSKEIKKIEGRSDEKLCFHEEECLKYNFRLFLKYSFTGYAIQAIKVILTNIKNPLLLLKSIISPQAFKLAAFLGGYALVYQTTKCYLYQKEGKTSPVQDAIAGFLAGATFRFQPAINIFNSAIISICQILTEMGCRNKVLPDIPYTEMAFIISSAIMFHVRVFLTQHTPKLVLYLTSAITSKRADFVTNECMKIAKKFENKV